MTKGLRICNAHKCVRIILCINIIHIEYSVIGEIIYLEKPCCQMVVDAGRSSATETGSYTHSSP